MTARHAAAARPVGRPTFYASADEARQAKNQRNAEYRARLKAQRQARRDPAVPLASKVIDLSVLAPWRRT